MKQVVILAGGKGSRLSSISGDLPKPMVPINGIPLLRHLIEKCVSNGFLDIKLLVSFRKEIIEEYFGNGDNFGAKIQYFVEKTPRGTAGALIDALPSLSDQFLIIYGDTYFEVDLDSFWKFHQEQKGDASIFLHPNDHPFDSDLVELDQFSRVKEIYPYPHDSQWRKNLVNAALYIFNNDAISDLEIESQNPDIAKDLFPAMLKAHKEIFGYVSTEYIKDMGTPKRLSKVIEDINSGKVQMLKKETPKIAIFLDRDGTINKEVGHLHDLEKFELLDGACQAIHMINKAGLLSIVVTNQPVVARGELKESELDVIHNKMDTLLGRQGAYIDRLYYCPHHTDKGFAGEVSSLKFFCNCRKPKTGMFIKAQEELNIDLQKSWMVGDSSRDIKAAKKLGMKSILVQTGFSGKDGVYNVEPNYIAENILHAIEIILNEINK